MRLPDPAELAAFEQFYDELLTPSVSKDEAYIAWLTDRENDLLSGGAGSVSADTTNEPRAVG